MLLSLCLASGFLETALDEHPIFVCSTAPNPDKSPPQKTYESEETNNDPKDNECGLLGRGASLRALALCETGTATRITTVVARIYLGEVCSYHRG